jgi:hypothetical protein
MPPPITPRAHCEVVLNYGTIDGGDPPRYCLEPLHTVVPLPGGTGVFVCGSHARHLTPEGGFR